MFSIGWGDNPGPVLAKTFHARPPRQRTCLSGKLVYGDGSPTSENAFTLDCSIRDISEGGARITLAQQRPLPAGLYLIIAKFCVAYRAELAWMKYPSRGLRFCTKYNLKAALPDEMTFLRRLWSDLSIRDGGFQQPETA